MNIYVKLIGVVSITVVILSLLVDSGSAQGPYLPQQWPVNNHIYQYFLENITSYTEAINKCANRANPSRPTSSKNGYLATVSSDAELQFLRSLSTFSGSIEVSPGVTINRYYGGLISGVTLPTEIGIFRYISGPEKGQIAINTWDNKNNIYSMYPVYPGVGAPNVEDFFSFNITTPNTIQLDMLSVGGYSSSISPFPYFPFNKPSGYQGYYCEWNDVDYVATTTPVSTNGGITVVTLESALSIDGLNSIRCCLVDNYTISLNDKSCSAPTDLISLSQFKCKIAAGTGTKLLRLALYPLMVAKYTLSFSYAQPTISFVIPVSDVAETVTIAGDSFGNDPTKISIRMGDPLANVAVECGNVSIITPMLGLSIITCKLTSFPTEGYTPIKIVVDGIQNIILQTPLLLRGKSKYYYYSMYPTTFQNYQAFSKNYIPLDGVNCITTVVPDQETLDFIGKFIPSSMVSAYGAGAWMGATFVNSTHVLVNEGQLANKIIKLYQPIITSKFASDDIYFNFKDKKYYQSRGETVGSLYEYSFEPPQFQDYNKTYELPSAGGQITLKLNNYGPMLGNNETLYVGKLKVSFTRSRVNPGEISFYCPALKGTYELKFIVNGISTQPNTQYVSMPGQNPSESDSIEVSSSDDSKAKLQLILIISIVCGVIGLAIAVTVTIIVVRVHKKRAIEKRREAVMKDILRK